MTLQELESALIAGRNWPIIVFSGFVTITFAWSIFKQLRERSADRKLLTFMFGIMFTSAGVFMTRLWWMSWRYARDWGYPEVAEMLNTHSSFLVITGGLMVLGYIFHLRTFLEERFERGWWVVGAGLGLVSFALGTLIGAA